MPNPEPKLVTVLDQIHRERFQFSFRTPYADGQPLRTMRHPDKRWTGIKWLDGLISIIRIWLTRPKLTASNLEKFNGH